jgi:hypothetical protein
MADVIEVPVKGGTLYFAAAGSTGPQAYSATTTTAKAVEGLEDILDRVRALGETIAERLRGLKRQNAEVTLGIKVTAMGKFIIAEAGAEASISIKLILPPD